jgi:multidrug efflux system outer membrane protein
MIRERASRALLLSAALLGGCTVGPVYRPPDVPLPDAWSRSLAAPLRPRPAELERWWRRFDDPLLGSLVERALLANPDLRLAEARVREARALRAAAASGLWPAVELSGSYSRLRSSENALPQRGFVGALPGLEREHDLFRAGFDASWEIDIFGGVRRGVEAAQASAEAAVEERRAVLVTLLGEVATNYVEHRALQRRLEVTRANLEAQRETLELTRVRFEAGLAAGVDVSRAEAQVSSTAAEIPALESAITRAAHRLDTLLGLHPGALAAELSSPAPVPRLPPEIMVGIPSDLLRRRPDIRRAERRLAAATARVGAAVAELFPRFSLTGAGGLESFGAGDFFAAGSRFWSLGPTVRWPVFSAGRIRANIEVQNARQEAALREYEKTVLGALEEVENALVALASEQARRDSLLGSVAASRRALESARELYLSGLADFLAVLDAQRALLAAENDLAASEAALASSLVSLYKALGGGWEAS